MPGTNQEKKSGDISCCIKSGSSSSVEVDDNLTDNNTCVRTHEQNSSLLTEVRDNKWTNSDLDSSNNNNTVPLVFSKREPVDVQFSNVTYDVRTYSWQRPFIRKKRILNGVSGEFRSGQFSAIMGPSGAGKTTLLKVLAGFVSEGVKGTFLVNGKPWDRKKFSNLSCYIMQEDELRDVLTIRESMTIAANLKLSNITYEQRQAQIERLLDTLGLLEHQNTRSGSLSGGQKKRLSIALELINDPPFIFLDEPTTGLDSSSCFQCVSLLKYLAREGRTIVCTIHQPSSLMFQMFDYVYALSNGVSIYHGSVGDLVPFLAKQGLQCPPYHNPADFLMEVASGEYNTDISKLHVAAVEMKTTDIPLQEITKKKSIVESMEDEISKLSKFNNNDDEDCHTVERVFPKRAGMFAQFSILFRRNILLLKRSYARIIVNFISHLMLGFVFGYFYHNVGANANGAFGNVVYVYGTTLLLAYTGKMAVVLMYPLEYKVLVREYFNQWYSLGPYAVTYFMIQIPNQIISCLLYLGVSYWLTGNSVEPFRMGLFYVFSVMVSLTAQSTGYLVGILFSVKVAVFVGPVVVGYLSNYGFSFFYHHIPWILKILFYVSYMRAAFQSNMFLLYGYDREPMPCEGKIYCHTHYPTKTLEMLDIDGINVYGNLGYLIVLTVAFHIITIYTLWYKLNKR